MLIEPGAAGLVCHGKNAIVSLFSKFINGKSRCGADQNDDESRDLSAPTLQKERDD